MHKTLDHKGEEIEYYIHDAIKNVILDKAKRVVLTMNNSFVAVIDGKSGVGKSTFGIQICRYLDPDFGLHKIAWTPDKFLGLIQNATKGDCIMFDEGMIINSRSATSAINKAIIVALSQIRSRNIYIIININAIFDLDKNISLHRADGLFHVYTKDDMVDGEKRIKFYGRHRLKNLYLRGKKTYHYGSPPNFFARPPRKYVFFLDENEYEKLKREETMRNIYGDDKSSTSYINRQYRSYLGGLLTYLKEHSEITQKAISEFLGVAPPRLSEWSKFYRDDKFKKEHQLMESQGLNSINPSV